MTSSILLSAFLLGCLASNSLTTPTNVENTSDGLYFQSQIVMNENENKKIHWLLPNSDHTAYNEIKRQLLREIMTFMEQRQKLQVLERTLTNETMTVIMDAIIEEACGYLRANFSMPNLNCTNTAEIESLRKHIEFTDLTIEDYMTVRYKGGINTERKNDAPRVNYWRRNIATPLCNRGYCSIASMDDENSVYSIFSLPAELGTTA